MSKEILTVNTTAILKSVDHRPYPLPAGPWVMTQIWHELLFAHWPIAADVLRPLVPAILPLDIFDGQAWLGVVPFHVSYARPRGVPSIPGVSRFTEMNVRTYVTVQGIPGVYFFSLDASNPIDVTTARKVFHLPYFNAVMRSLRVDDSIHYRSRRTHRGAPSAQFEALYRPIARVAPALRGTLEYWLTERYCLYTVMKHDLVYRCDIHHQPWPLQAAELETARNTMAQAQGIHLPDTPSLLHYAQRQEVLVWWLRRVL